MPRTRDINLLLLYLLSRYACCWAQVPAGYAWWQRKHAVTSATPLDYVRRMPAYMGPNALPVPEVYDTRVAYRTGVLAGGEYFSGKGESTVNPDLGICYPLQKNRISIAFRSKLFESYRMTEALRDARFVRDSAGTGSSRGESFLDIRCRVWQGLWVLPDLSVAAGIKFPSGNNLVNARHTQAPAYWIIGIAGKDVWRNSACTLRITASLGGYFWQWGDYRRCNALLFGAGCVLIKNHINWYNGLQGYNGFSGNGDAPLLYRSRLEVQGKKGSAYLGYQWGIRNYITHTLQMGIIRKLGLPDRLNPY